MQMLFPSNQCIGIFSNPLYGNLLLLFFKNVKKMEKKRKSHMTI